MSKQANESGHSREAYDEGGCSSDGTVSSLGKRSGASKTAIAQSVGPNRSNPAGTFLRCSKESLPNSKKSLLCKVARKKEPNSGYSKRCKPQKYTETRTQLLFSNEMSFSVVCERNSSFNQCSQDLVDEPFSM